MTTRTSDTQTQTKGTQNRPNPSEVGGRESPGSCASARESIPRKEGQDERCAQGSAWRAMNAPRGAPPHRPSPTPQKWRRVRRRTERTREPRGSNRALPFLRVCRRASDAPRSPEIARRGPEIARDSARSPEIARRGPRSPEIARFCGRRGGWVGSEGAEVSSAVDGQLGAREPDLGAGRLSFSLCVLAHGVRGISSVAVPNCHSPLSRPGWGARGSGGCAGCLWARERCACVRLAFVS